MIGVSPRLKQERAQEMIQWFWMYRRMMLRDERGAVAIEYGLMAALIAAAVFAGVNLLGTSLTDLFTAIKDLLVSVTTPLGGGTPSP